MRAGEIINVTLFLSISTCGDTTSRRTRRNNFRSRDQSLCRGRDYDAQSLHLCHTRTRYATVGTRVSRVQPRINAYEHSHAPRNNRSNRIEAQSSSSEKWRSQEKENVEEGGGRRGGGASSAPFFRDAREWGKCDVNR